MDARLAGLDLARFLAIAGMIVAHTVPQDEQGTVPGYLVTGNASTLFAVASGFSVALASRRYLAEGAIRSARVALLVRGAMVIVIGLFLALLEQQAVVVLVYLGVAMCLAVPFIASRTSTVVVWAAVLAAIVPVFNWWIRTVALLDSETWSIGFPELLDPARALRGVLLTGTYPALTWLVYLLVGLLLGRAAITATQSGRGMRFAIVLAASGTGAALLAGALSVGAGLLLGAGNPPVQFYGGPIGSASTLLSAVPHSGTVLDIVRGIGVSGAAIGLCLLLFAAAPRAASLLRPLIAAGAAPLSAYVLHLLTLAVVAAVASQLPLAGTPWWVEGWGAAALNIAIVVALGAALAAAHERGPFEVGISRLARLAADRVRPRVAS